MQIKQKIESSLKLKQNKYFELLTAEIMKLFGNTKSKRKKKMKMVKTCFT